MHVQNLGCERIQRSILCLVVSVCELLRNSVWGVVEKCRIFTEHAVVDFFSEKKKCLCPSSLSAKAFSSWCLVLLSRIFVCFSCTDVVKLKLSHFVGYLRNHVCWAWLTSEVHFKAVLNSSARNTRRVHCD